MKSETVNKKSLSENWKAFGFNITTLYPSPYSYGWFRYLALPVALALSLAMLALSLTLPTQYSTEILLSILFWAGTGDTVYLTLYLKYQNMIRRIFLSVFLYYFSHVRCECAYNSEERNRLCGPTETCSSDTPSTAFHLEIMHTSTFNYLCTMYNFPLYEEIIYLQRTVYTSRPLSRNVHSGP